MLSTNQPTVRNANKSVCIRATYNQWHEGHLQTLRVNEMCANLEIPYIFIIESILIKT